MKILTNLEQKNVSGGNVSNHGMISQPSAIPTRLEEVLQLAFAKQDSLLRGQLADISVKGGCCD